MEKSFPELLRQLAVRGYSGYAELIVALNREGVIAAQPQLHFILQAMSAGGYIRAVENCLTLAAIDRLAEQFATHTGFRRDFTDYVFQSFGYACSLLTDAPQAPPAVEPRHQVEPVSEGDAEDCNAAGGVAEEPSEGYLPLRGGESAEPEAWNPRWSEEEKCRSLTSLIYVNNENERRIGLRLETAACCHVDEYGFRLSAEIRRVRPDATGALYYAVYDRSGNVAEVSALGMICFDDISVKPVVAESRVIPSQVGRIVLFWD